MRAAPQRLVLVGGGHTHVLVLRALGMARRQGLDITLIARELDAPYSGMLPGFVAGHYRLDECLIDVARLVQFARARLIHGAATGLDRERRLVLVEGQEPVSYDFVSIDVGITPDVAAITGAEAHALIVKPVSVFAPKWQALEARVLAEDDARRIVAVGGGAAGVELILAARHKLMTRAREAGRERGGFGFAIVAGGDVLPGQAPRAQRLAKCALEQAGVEIVASDPVVAIGAGGVTLASGRRLLADAAIVSTKARAAAWLAETGLPVDRGGFLLLAETLASLGDDRVFAAGDCATVAAHPRPKAGVFAVRQGPILYMNLMRRLDGQPLQSFVPQKDYLALISLGQKRAIATRGSLAVEGRWAWTWKDWIDRRFMRLFEGLGVADG